jgi:TonB family protein
MLIARRYLLYFAFSIGFHACLFLAFFFWKVVQEPQPEPHTVLLEVHGLKPRQSRPDERPSAPKASDSTLSSGLAVPEPGALGLVREESRTSRVVKAGIAADIREPAPIARNEQPRRAEPSDAFWLPSPAETLREALTGSSRKQVPAASAAGEAEGGYAQETALEWKGKQRQMLRRFELGFPELLAEKGLEVDVEAAFAVAPSGQVTRVEITRSSGFASVDRSVEQAMYNTLFEASSGEEEDQGRISLHFRLERKP